MIASRSNDVVTRARQRSTAAAALRQPCFGARGQRCPPLAIPAGARATARICFSWRNVRSHSCFGSESWLCAPVQPRQSINHYCVMRRRRAAGVRTNRAWPRARRSEASAGAWHVHGVTCADSRTPRHTRVRARLAVRLGARPDAASRAVGGRDVNVACGRGGVEWVGECMRVCDGGCTWRPQRDRGGGGGGGAAAAKIQIQINEKQTQTNRRSR